MKVIYVSPVSVTLELDNNYIYYNNKNFSVSINGKKILSEVNKNVFSIFDLEPNTEYLVKANKQEIKFKTKKVNNIINLYSIDSSCNSTKEIQKVIDEASDNDLIIFNKGNYFISPLKLKSNLNIYFKKGSKLIASTKEKDFPEIDGEEIIDGKLIERGTWEGLPCKMKLALLNCIDCNDVNIFGEGTIDMNALKSTWFNNYRNKKYARPHTIFINQSKNVYVQGLNLINACVWTIHSYFSSHVGFYDLFINNKKDSPNTDGISPQCTDNCDIIGVHFNVGDDCVSIKSGKLELAKKIKKASSKITVRNCLMEHGHGAIVLGSEMSSGIKNLRIERCLFDKTDRGLRIKTRRGRGKNAVIDGIKFSNIKMKNVLTPFVINMFYFCDPDGKTEYVWSKEKLPVNELTPYLGKFVFEDIECNDSEYCAGFFYGLPERKIKKLVFKNIKVSFLNKARKGVPAMMSFIDELSKSGFIFNNVKKVVLDNVTVKKNVGPEVIINNVNRIIRR